MTGIIIVCNFLPKNLSKCKKIYEGGLPCKNGINVYLIHKNTGNSYLINTPSLIACPTWTHTHTQPTGPRLPNPWWLHNLYCK